MKCPKCNSLEIHKYYVGSVGGTEYICKECKVQFQINSGGIILIISDDLK